MNSFKCFSCLILICIAVTVVPTAATPAKYLNYTFGFPFDTLTLLGAALIDNGALQLTPDSNTQIFDLSSLSGRALFSQPFLLWTDNDSGTKVASFNTTFLFNISSLYPDDPTYTSGQGLAFVISPDLALPPSSSGQFLGVTNAASERHADSKILAVEFDTHKNGAFDLDDNHVGLDINSIISKQTVPLSGFNITLSSSAKVLHKVWINYDGVNKEITVYIRELTDEYAAALMPQTPVMHVIGIDLSQHLHPTSYFGFSASLADDQADVHAILSWNLTVEFIGNPTPTPTPNTNRSRRPMYIGVGISLGFVLLVLLILTLWYCNKLKNQTQSDQNLTGALQRLPGQPREFKYKDLREATENFDDKYKLGQGGYGTVYRALLPRLNYEVAVKKFSRDETKSKADFLAELTIINQLRHRNLVKLLGWCHQNGMLLLVYEYMPNGSLDKHIFNQVNETILLWELRYKALTGVASALHFLHYDYDDKVIHRDLKASNVMLDDNFNASLGDFGLARAVDHNKTSYAEMEGVHGSVGYIAPECLQAGRFTRESDVYAFGAVILEVACGLRPWTRRDQYECLVDWVWSKHREGSILDAIDQRLGNAYRPEEAEQVLLLGLACSNPISSERPKTHAIMQVLSGSMPAPSVPPFKPIYMWPSMEPNGDTMSEHLLKTSTHNDLSEQTSLSISPR